MAEIRLLTASDIECRVQQVDKAFKWCSLLLYKNARVDMQILDETFGRFGWQRTHEIINGRLYCTVSIYDNEKKQWVSKQDVGTESNTEAEKGQASDAFKRACFNIGIGRELYTSPKIFVTLFPDDIRNNKIYTKFEVSEIGYNGNAINFLRIKDDKGNIRFEYAEKEVVLNQVRNANNVSELTWLFNMHKELQADSEFMSALTEKKKSLTA